MESWKTDFFLCGSFFACTTKITKSMGTQSNFHPTMPDVIVFFREHEIRMQSEH